MGQPDVVDVAQVFYFFHHLGRNGVVQSDDHHGPAPQVQASHFIKRYVRDDGFFVSLQNCWNDVPMGEIVGSTRQLGCSPTRNTW